MGAFILYSTVLNIVEWLGELCMSAVFFAPGTRCAASVMRGLRGDLDPCQVER